MICPRPTLGTYQIYETTLLSLRSQAPSVRNESISNNTRAIVYLVEKKAIVTSTKHVKQDCSSSHGQEGGT